MKSEGIEFLDLEYGEVLEAVEEFEQLVSAGREAFRNYSSKQRDYLNLAKKEHFFLYQSKAVPLNCYLDQFDSSNSSDNLSDHSISPILRS